MKITRIINNNTIATIANKKEIILMGSGIGFQKKPGDAVEVNRIEKVYQIRDRFFQKYKKVIRVGIALSCQLAEQVPMEAYDILMDYLVTPEKIYKVTDNRDENK